MMLIKLLYAGDTTSRSLECQPTASYSLSGTTRAVRSRFEEQHRTPDGSRRSGNENNWNARKERKFSVTSFLVMFLIAFASVLSTSAFGEDEQTFGPAPPPKAEVVEVEMPWDYSPYRVLVWIASDDPSISVGSVEAELREYLDRDFSSIWRTTLLDAPGEIHAMMFRDLDELDYDSLSAADPILAVKRDHENAIRIRSAANVGEFIQQVLGTETAIASLKQFGSQSGKPELDGVAKRLTSVAGDSMDVVKKWSEAGTEAVLLSRGLANTLTEPEAKLISPTIDNLVATEIEDYDKVFLVRVRTQDPKPSIDVVEMDVLIRFFGSIKSVSLAAGQTISESIGQGLIQAFSPVVRIEDAGQSSADGLLRAGGLIVNENSPGKIRIGDVLIPATRKDDRNGNPFLIGPIDWAYLHATESEIAVLSAGGKTGLKVGDQVLGIAGKTIIQPQRLIRRIDEMGTSSAIDVQIRRGKKEMDVEVNVDAVAQPVRLQYLGFSASVRRGKVIVRQVISGGPAQGQLKPNDAILAINSIKIDGMDSFDGLVISNKPDQKLKLSIVRDDSPMEVTLKPGRQSVRQSREDNTVEMNFFAGRNGGLQGRKNSRTHRVGIKVKPTGNETMLRLHAQGKPNFPLIGYEIYEKSLQTKDMKFVGRTDWNGRMSVEKNDEPLRLMYVKNGGAVLARLPMVPGLDPKAVADIRSDDMRLEAESYIRGVQNSIIDLVAVRELFKARITMRLQEGELEAAEELMESLRGQPSNEALANDMGKRQAIYLKVIGKKNANQRRMVEQMFSTTRELLGKHINPKLVRDLDGQIIIARKNGGKLPPKPVDPADED